MRAVNVNPNDGEKALEEMAAKGAHLVRSDEVLKGSKPASAAAR
jgi:hypothetical protein